MFQLLLDPAGRRRVAALFDRLGLTYYAELATKDAERAERLIQEEKAKIAAAKAKEAAKPKPPPRWRFAAIPDDAITKRWRGGVRLALHGELDGYALWVRNWRIRHHAEFGHVMPLRFDVEMLAEKRERKSRGWKTVATKALDRKALLALFREVPAKWDDLESENKPDDEPDWMTDGRNYVKDTTPAPLETESREIAEELLMGSEEDSWKELEEGS